MRALVTIGEFDNWAPPRMCGFEIENFVIVNTNSVWWDIKNEGLVTRWALRWPQGWHELPLPEPLEVEPLHLTPAVIARHALRVEVFATGVSLGNRLPESAIERWHFG